jgi:cytidylate kinase
MAGQPLIVAIDGPAGAGKSTVSKILARRLGFALVDTGAIYRCVALAAQQRKIRFDDDERLGALLDALTISFKVEGENNHVFLDGHDVSEAIRTPDISIAASQVSARPVVRDGLLELQRRLAGAAKIGAILEGRDIGTVVFPHADLKFFLHADPDVRGRRRYEELFQKGVDKSLKSVLEEQQRRDKEDTERAAAPLKAAEDAVVIDSSSMPLSEVVRQLEETVRAALQKKR